MYDASFNSSIANCKTRVFDKGTLATYGVFAATFFVVWCLFSHSFVETLDHLMVAAAALQLGALCILAVKVYQFKTVEGLSLKMLIIYAISFVLRLSNTLFFRGYIPEDSTADVYMYQIIEILSFAVCIWLIFQTLVVCGKTYDGEHDSMPAWWMIFVVSIVLGALTHSNANRNKFFDMMWMVSMYLDAFSMVPQLYMISQACRVERWTSHFVAWTVVGRFTMGIFWVVLQYYYSFGTWAFAGGIFFSLFVQGLLSADYLYHFAKTYSKPEMTMEL